MKHWESAGCVVGKSASRRHVWDILLLCLPDCLYGGDRLMGILLMESCGMTKTRSHLFSDWLCSFTVGWKPGLDVFMSAHPDESRIIYLLRDSPSLALFLSASTDQPFSYRSELNLFQYLTDRLSADPLLNSVRNKICIPRTKWLQGKDGNIWKSALTI
jgi:hypothetical protein